MCFALSTWKNQSTKHQAPSSLLVLHRLKESLEFARARGIARFPQRLGLNLTNTFTSDREMLADFFECVFRTRRAKAEAHLDDLLFARRQRGQDFICDLAQVGSHHSVRWIQNRLVFDKVTQMRIFF